MQDEALYYSIHCPKAKPIIMMKKRKSYHSPV